MRIAIVSDFFLDYVGGAQTSIFEQKASLEEQGHTVYLVSAVSKTRGHVEGLDLAVPSAFTVPGLHLPVVRNRSRLVTTLAEFFYAEGIQVVHPQTEFGLAHAAVTAARQLGLPVVHTVHTFYWTSSGVGPTLAAPIVRAFLQNVTAAKFGRHDYGTGRPSDDTLRNLTLCLAERADVVVSPSAHQGADLHEAGLTSPVEIVPNPISRSPRAASLVTEELAASPRIVWVARCEPEKRPLVFAHAAIDALERTTGGFDVDFVGDGSELQAVRELTAGHPQFHVHGNLGHDAVIDLMDAAALVALTSHGFDNQPMTIAEAVSRYRGVLFCDPKLREGLGDSGWLSATPDAADLADAIVELVSSPTALRALSVGAKKDSAVFSASTYVERVMAVYAHATALQAAVLQAAGLDAAGLEAANHATTDD
jgi:glycosyltransferase involved in cell wall biosynthesis